MDQDYRKQISQSFLNGMLKVIVLYQASVGPVYGGRLRNDLRAQGYEISPGSLYPLLHSLEQSDLLKSRLKVYKGRMRKYYEITVCGKTCLDEMRTQVGDIVREVFFEIAPETKGTPAENHEII
jgi:DNA-binding PadR family transcriptional regulator